MRMTLIDDWQRLWHKLWSARLALLTGLLGVIQSGFDYASSGQPKFFVVVATLTAFGAFVARFVAQPGLKDGDQ